MASPRIKIESNELQRLLEAGCKPPMIAKILQVHPATVYRHLERSQQSSAPRKQAKATNQRSVVTRETLPVAPAAPEVNATAPDTEPSPWTVRTRKSFGPDCPPSKVESYRAILPPRCNGRKGCQACWDKYARVLQEEYQQTPPSPGSDFDTAMATFTDWLGWKNYKPSSPPEVTVKDQYNRILVLNDLHVPYHDRTKLKYIVENHKGKVDLCVVAGDLSDQYRTSRFPKRRHTHDFKAELQEVAAVITYLAESFPRVMLMIGNHDGRLEKYMIGRGVDGDILQALKYLYANFSHPLAALVEKFNLKNVEVVKPLVRHQGEYNFLWQYNDLILGHPEKFSQIPNRAVGSFIHWLMSYAIPQKLVKPFTMVGMGHTHQAGKTWNDYGIVGMELGCLAETPDYAGDPKMHGAQRPPVLGYSLFYQDRKTGATNRNLSNFFELS